MIEKIIIIIITYNIFHLIGTDETGLDYRM